MKLKQFSKYINKTVKEAGKTNPDIFFYIGNSELDLTSIGQFGVIPDVNINFIKRRKHELG